MAFTFDIHHILTKEALAQFKDRIDALFAGELNPFDVDGNINKVALMNEPALASAMQLLSANGNTAFSAIGFGNAAHQGIHPGLNSFQMTVFGQIFNPIYNLTSAQKKLAVFDLQKFSTAAAMSGNPPIMGTTSAGWLAQWGDTQSHFNQITSGNATALSAEYNSLLSHLQNSTSPILSDVGSTNNFEASELIAD